MKMQYDSRHVIAQWIAGTFLHRFYTHFTRFGSCNLHSQFKISDMRRKEECYGNPIKGNFKKL